MRALLLLLLGAGLVWFVWRGFGPTRSEEVGAASSEPGAMIAVDEPQPAPANPAAGADAGSDAGSIPMASDADPASGSAAASAEALVSPSPANRQDPVATSVPTPQPDRDASAGFSSDQAEVAAADQLLQDPAGVGAGSTGPDAPLPSSRRILAVAFAQALAGREPGAATELDQARARGEVLAGEIDLVHRIAARSETPLAISDDSPLARAASMKDLERRVAVAAAAGLESEAAAGLSRLLLAEVSSPWPADSARLAAWSGQLREVQVRNRWNRRGKWPSIEVEVQAGDSLIALRKRAVAANPNLLVCTGQIARANQLGGDVIHPGDRLRIPTDVANMRVDLDAHWAFYLVGDEVVAAWPVGVGKEHRATQVGTFTVGEKTPEPMWFPQGRKPVPYGDPENPLGTRWIEWLTTDGRATGLGIHGTNEPDSIGKNASLGCIRMRTGDVEELFEILPKGARVVVVP